MLKTLRITSLIAFVLAVCGVILILLWGLKGRPDIKDFLQTPGITEILKKPGEVEKDDKEPVSPLVTQAHDFALRIDPPKPPPPPKTDSTPVTTTKPLERKPTPPIPSPKVSPSAKFTLMATVQCQSNPSRSMVLLRQAGNKDEWFWQGEKIGRLTIDEIRDGSAVFSQEGRDSQEYFVPLKPQTKSLLKADSGQSSVPVRRGTINVDLQPAAGATDAWADLETVITPATPVRRSTRSRTSSEQARQDVSSRIRRIRAVPKPPTPEKQKASLDESISSIQEIMNREDAGLDAEQRQKEKEAWTNLMKALQSEKGNIPVSEEETAKQGESSQADDEGESDTAPVPGDPNEN